VSRGRHLFAALAAALPILVVALLVDAGWGSTGPLVVAALWFAAAMAVEAVLWFRQGRLLDTAARTLGVAPQDMSRALRELSDRAEASRVESERLAGRLEDLSSGLADGLLVVTSDLRVRLINQPALDFCGVDAADRGSHLLEILRDPSVIEVVEAAAKGERPDAEVVENRNGLWEIRASPVREGGAVVLFSEVSLIRRSAEFRRRFVQDLSHELRSPLTVLRTTVEALEDEVDPRLAEVLVRQVERLDRLTRELYDLATIESGQLELEHEEVRLQSLVRDVLGDFGPEAAATGVDLRDEVSQDVVVWCDRRGLYRILSNLVDNAVKYNRCDGWVEIWARTKNDEITIRISDSGEGIPPGELRAVSQRFYRVDRARTPGQGGLGLGLAIVKHMVQYMDGRLDLRSREGVGTTVTINLPVAPSSDAS
jgi:two-component system, OmpR family, phosphate regulon sensor histidine kinase PhoR